MSAAAAAIAFGLLKLFSSQVAHLPLSTFRRVEEPPAKILKWLRCRFAGGGERYNSPSPCGPRKSVRMNELELRNEIAANVQHVGSESAPTVTGDITTIDVFVIVTINAAGDTQLQPQRIHIVDRGGAGETATYGGRRYVNYVAPPETLSNAEFFLANASAIVASVPNAAGYELAGDLTAATQSLPVRIKNGSGAYIDGAGAVDASGPRYLVMRVDAAPGWVLLPYNPSDSVA